MSAYSSAHKAYVQLLYKRFLRNALDHHIRRDNWRIVAMDIRAQFEANRNVQNPKQLAAILAGAEAHLQSKLHGQPYIPPAMPGGTKWERNIPPRMDLTPERALQGDRPTKHWKQSS